MPTRPTSKPKVLRTDIQALRTVAVLSVIVYHLWPDSLVGGFIGVDIFLVISGYLMTKSVMKHITPLARKRDLSLRSIWLVLTDFYARRIKRLVPAALTTLLAILGLTYLTGNLNALITNAKNTLSAATFWQNWLLAKDSVDYLGQDNAVVASQHFWSLSLEEQFYLIWPILLILSTLITLNIVVLYKRSRIPGLILPVILLTLLSLGYGIWLTTSDATVAYYATSARIWELMVGGVIALLPAIKSYDLKLLLPHAGAVIITYSLFFIGIENFPGWVALIPVIGTAMIVHGGTDPAESNLSFDRILRWRPIQWIGDISYSLYLWHFPFIILLPILIKYPLSDEYGYLFQIGIIIATFIAAQLSYKFIEQPFQKAAFTKRTIYIGFFVTTALVVGLSYGMKHYAEIKIDVTLKDMHAAAVNQDDRCFGARSLVNKDKCDDPFGDIDPNYLSVGQHDHFRDIIQDNGRHCQNFRPDKSEKNDPKHYCTYGDTDADRSIVIIGDSHADHYINAFDDIGRRNNYKIYQLGTVTCLEEDARSEHADLCEDREQFITEKQRLDESSLIVVSILFQDNIEKNTEALLSDLKNTTDTNIALLHDTPHSTRDDLSTCYTTNTHCVQPEDDSTHEESELYTNFVKGKHKKQQVIAKVNIDDAFCDEDDCYSSIGGIPVYYDTSDAKGTPNSHITASYSLSLSHLIEQRLIDKNLLPRSDT